MAYIYIYIVIPLEVDGETSSVCTEYHPTLNKRLLRWSRATEEFQFVLSFNGTPWVLSYKSHKCIHIPLDKDPNASITDTTTFTLCRYSFLLFGSLWIGPITIEVRHINPLSYKLRQPQPISTLQYNPGQFK